MNASSVPEPVSAKNTVGCTCSGASSRGIESKVSQDPPSGHFRTCTVSPQDTAGFLLLNLCLTSCGAQELSFGKEIFFGVKAAEEISFAGENPSCRNFMVDLQLIQLSVDAVLGQ